MTLRGAFFKHATGDSWQTAFYQTIVPPHIEAVVSGMIFGMVRTFDICDDVPSSHPRIESLPVFKEDN